MRPLAIAVVMALAVTACNGESEDATTTSEGSGGQATTQPAPDESTTTGGPGSTAGPGTTAPPASGGGISTGDSSLGEVLVDDAGLTLYIFGVDADGESSCYDSCASNWPAVPASLMDGTSVDVELGSHDRTDGVEQLTVNGRPVYLYAGDSSPGDVNGQGVGDVWFAVGSNGEPITE